MDVATFDSIKAYADFGEAQSVALREFRAIAAPHFAAIVDDFYAAIQAHPRARVVITGGKQQIERLKYTLIEWLDSVLLGPHDESYLAAHSRIGRVHVRIGLPQEFMFSAMDRIRLRLMEVHDSFPADAPRREAMAQAIHQVLDLELAIMLDTYREDLVTKVRTMERLATIGQLAANVGHELRNPLAIIESSLFLIEQRTQKLGIQDEVLLKHYDKIRGQVMNCSTTTDGLLDLARDRPPKRRRVLVLPLIELALDQSGTRDVLDVKKSVPDGLVIDADPDDLVRVLANLLRNAAEAQGGKGCVWLEAASFRGGTEIRVRDEGPGVPEELSHRIFDALFTTKPRGTGLGLALCRRILYAHGGEIGLVPSDRGACFRIWIPERESSAGDTSSSHS